MPGKLAPWAVAAVFALLLVTPVTAAQTTSYTSWSWEDRALESARLDTIEVTALPDHWLARDKALHVGASFLLTLSSQYVFENKLELTHREALPLAMTSALSAGVLKEVLDSRRSDAPHFCYRDLVADTVGVLLGAGLILL